ncbi:hypothetical protein J6590_098280 [Homalodisca vitripennis]|nr:hypothetical protein J6590_098280 [Homalodisca vitripennis]
MPSLTLNLNRTTNDRLASFLQDNSAVTYLSGSHVEYLDDTIGSEKGVGESEKEREIEEYGRVRGEVLGQSEWMRGRRRDLVKKDRTKGKAVRGIEREAEGEGEKEKGRARRKVILPSTKTLNAPKECFNNASARDGGVSTEWLSYFCAIQCWTVQLLLAAILDSECDIAFIFETVNTNRPPLEEKKKEDGEKSNILHDIRLELFSVYVPNSSWTDFTMPVRALINRQRSFTRTVQLVMMVIRGIVFLGSKVRESPLANLQVNPRQFQHGVLPSMTFPDRRPQHQSFVQVRRSTSVKNLVDYGDSLSPTNLLNS